VESGAAGFSEWLTILNTIGFPLLVIYAHFRGWVVTPRELNAAVKFSDDLQTRYTSLEAEVKADKADMRAELAQTRQELAETRSMLMRLLARQEIVVPANAAAGATVPASMMGGD
jgi:hypothetical protein